MGVTTPVGASEEANANANGANVKYRLVEAEEVDASAAQKVVAGGKKKGKTHWTQLPLSSEEATTEVAGDEAHDKPDFRPRGYRGRGRGGRFYGGRGPRRHFDEHGVYYNGVYVPNPDNRVTAEWAKAQVEFYFSPDNLVRDVFLRQHMDVDGYVPLPFIAGFQAVYSIHQDYPSLLEAMRKSEVVELDEENEKIRLRGDWPKWLWPNEQGGYGVPRYIKIKDSESDKSSSSQQNEPEHEDAAQTTA